MRAGHRLCAWHRPRKSSRTLGLRCEIVVPPTALPSLARRAGEAMFLHDNGDGRNLLYVEQHGGTELAIFDVTDPGHVRGRGKVRLDAPGVFDFVAHLVRVATESGTVLTEPRRPI